MTTITADHLATSVADALQFMSYYHPKDFIVAVHDAYRREESPAAKDALAQILVNSRMCAQGHRPLCQDTGIVTVFIKIGMDVRWDGAGLSVADMINAGVRRAYTHPDNVLRASIVTDPGGARNNTGDNTPAVIHTQIVPGDKVEVQLAAKGGGSENKAKLAMLNPSDSIADWVVDVVPTLGAGWCPPGILGLGIGGTAEKAAVLAKEALLAPIDIQQLRQRGARTRLEALRLEILERVNDLGIGAQGLGGLTTALDVKVLDYPTHVASLPVALIPNCAATRHAHFTLDGSGPALQEPPSLDDWPEISWEAAAGSRRVDLDTITRADIATWRPGETLLLSGSLLTGRDAAHKRIDKLLKQGQPLPEGIDFTDRFIYYVGPVDAVRDEAVGPAGPTTATRMDKFTDLLLEKTGLIGMVGKAERGPEGLAAIKKHGAVYLTAVGGAAYLVARAITASRVVAFADLGMEAIHEFQVRDMPVTVAVDCNGSSIHQAGPARWREIIFKKSGRKPGRQPGLMSELKAIIFDMDGTLADTEELHRQAFNLAFREAACTLNWSRREYRQLLSISGGRERIYHCLQQAGTDATSIEQTVGALHRRKSTLYRQLLGSDVIGLRPGIRRLVQECRAAGLKLAIATSSSTDNVHALLRRTFGSAGAELFPVVVTCDLVRDKKPAPAVYLYALSALALSAEHCIAMEDTANGNRAALAAGIKTVITTHPLTVDNDFTGASLVLNHLGEPNQPFEVKTGAAHGRGYVDLALLRLLHSGAGGDLHPPRRGPAPP